MELTSFLSFFFRHYGQIPRNFPSQTAITASVASMEWLLSLGLVIVYKDSRNSGREARF